MRLLTLLVMTVAGSGGVLVTRPGEIMSNRLPPADKPHMYRKEAVAFAGLGPQDSETREVRSLDGLWQFRLAPPDDPDQGFRDHWYAAPLSETGPVLDMPVPASYNDITEQRLIRDHVGWAWYSTQTWVPKGWRGQRMVIRVGSAHYTAVVYINGNFIVNHYGGHLPFAADVTADLKPGQLNLVTIAVNNTLTNITIPQGETVHKENKTGYIYPAGYSTLDYNFDFFNYAGIHRPVLLYTTPQTYVNDVIITTSLLTNGSASVGYHVSAATQLPDDDVSVNITLLAPSGSAVLSATGIDGALIVSEPLLWWPYLMDPSPGRQYTLVIQMTSKSRAKDVYRQKFGIRELGWTNETVTINGKPIYIHGFSKHEDSDIRGKGLDLPLLAKDFNLIKWVGANCFRTSHYPYAEEIMDAADSRGILVIDETPAVSVDYSRTGEDDRLLNHHLAVLDELIGRDKNRPSVLMWSLSNEAKTAEKEAVPYYTRLVEFVRSKDPTRPVTAVLNTYPNTDMVAQLLDVVCVNRYFSWYSDTGHVELVELQAVHLFTQWRQAFNKPVVNSEYGADTVAGLHQIPEFVFTEEYQTRLMMNNFHAFEKLRAQGWFLGELIWNFADFMTKQDTTRVVGNRKGIFTRQRQPKMSAHLLRSRYWRLAKKVDDPDLTLPDDLMFSETYAGVTEQLICPAA